MRAQLQHLQDNGVLSLREYTFVNRLNEKLDEIGKRERWLVETANSKTGETLEIEVDTIWLATGTCMDIETDPLFQTIVQQYPIESHCGIPALRSDLSWSVGLPNLYGMGAYSAFQLGPNALNLIGGKAGAERISETLVPELLGEFSDGDQTDTMAGHEVFGDAGNFYSLLENLVIG